jgi:dipeptidyl aminopeptidase/acylaminoacyl peptidase
LTTVSGFLADPRWSPDGARLGVLFTQGAARANGPLQPGAIRTGVIDDEAVLEQRLSTIELSSGALRQVSPPDLYVYEYDWSPDSTQCVAIAAHGSGDDHWYIAQLYVLAVATGEARSILDPKMQVAMPRWSPDGRTIAFLGGLMSDEGVNGGDEDAGGGDPDGGLSGGGPHDRPGRASPGPRRADGGVVQPVSGAGAGASELRRPLGRHPRPDDLRCPANAANVIGLC